MGRQLATAETASETQLNTATSSLEAPIRAANSSFARRTSSIHLPHSIPEKTSVSLYSSMASMTSCAIAPWEQFARWILDLRIGKRSRVRSRFSTYAPPKYVVQDHQDNQERNASIPGEAPVWIEEHGQQYGGQQSRPRDRQDGIEGGSQGQRLSLPSRAEAQEGNEDHDPDEDAPEDRHAKEDAPGVGS